MDIEEEEFIDDFESEQSDADSGGEREVPKELIAVTEYNQVEKRMQQIQINTGNNYLLPNKVFVADANSEIPMPVKTAEHLFFEAASILLQEREEEKKKQLNNDNKTTNQTTSTQPTIHPLAEIHDKVIKARVQIDNISGILGRVLHKDTLTCDQRVRDSDPIICTVDQYRGLIMAKRTQLTQSIADTLTNGIDSAKTFINRTRIYQNDVLQLRKHWKLLPHQNNPRLACVDLGGGKGKQPIVLNMSISGHIQLTKDEIGVEQVTKALLKKQRCTLFDILFYQLFDEADVCQHQTYDTGYSIETSHQVISAIRNGVYVHIIFKHGPNGPFIVKGSNVSTYMSNKLLLYAMRYAAKPIVPISLAEKLSSEQARISSRFNKDNHNNMYKEQVKTPLLIELLDLLHYQQKKESLMNILHNIEQQSTVFVVHTIEPKHNIMQFYISQDHNLLINGILNGTKITCSVRTTTTSPPPSSSSSVVRVQTFDDFTMEEFRDILCFINNPE